MNLIGKDIIYKLSKLGAVGLSLSIRPPIGEEWVVYRAFAWHNDATARQFTITFTDADGNTLSSAVKTTNANVRMPIVYYNDEDDALGFPQPLRLSYDHYVTATLNALDAGDTMYLGGQFLARPQNIDLLIWEMIAAKLGYKLPISSRE